MNVDKLIEALEAFSSSFPQGFFKAVGEYKITGKDEKGLFYSIELLKKSEQRDKLLCILQNADYIIKSLIDNQKYNDIIVKQRKNREEQKDPSKVQRKDSTVGPS